ncbi:protein suppressor of underreplication [Hermetia illucens]|uniref:protein suppressor of underreplication n=1 Tax=Hermetia illucens TaxID=343691 RepID=UPI0018CC3304|nr:protein suppressor of underreplication [Hermetia illucens]
MVRDIFHFRAERLAQDLILSSTHRVLGKLAQYLTSFQLDGIRFLYKNFENNQACILNDESGLGKTALVGAFLSAVLPPDNSKRCLIIVKNAERIRNWQFHLDALTKLRVKLLAEENEIGSDNNVFLVTWENLRKSPGMAKAVFNCVILDDRDDLTTSKACLNFFLRHFENRISLIVASSDVTLDIKQLHSLLRLCGRLDAKYQKLKVFEEKFSLPKPEGRLAEDRAVLEAYFQRREKILNYCRDFRLRRYKHQFEDILPLVTPSEYEKSLQEWQEKEFSKSLSSSSGSLKVLSSSSEKNTEELFQTYFDPKTENLLNNEVQKINENAINSEADKEKIIHDTEDMSPLLFESDTEELSIIPPAKFNEVESKPTQPNVKRPAALRVLRSSTSGSSGVKSEKDKAPQPSPSVKTSQKKSRHHRTSDINVSQERIVRSLRSADRKTRQAKGGASSRNAIVDVFRMIERAEAEEKKIKKKKRKASPAVAKQEAQEPLNVSSDSESEIGEGEKLEYHPDPEAKIIDQAKQLDTSPNSNYNFNIDFLSKTLAPPDSSEIHIYSPPEQIVILSSSTEHSEDTVPRISSTTSRKVIQSGTISPSPDIFENYDEYDFFCSQRGKSPRSRSLLYNPQRASSKKSAPSCLERLSGDYSGTNKTNNYLFSGILADMVEIHTPNLGKTTWNCDSHRNKITKYLSSQSFDSTQSNRPDTTTKDFDNFLQTPKRRMSSVSQKGSPAISKKSPKSQRHTPVTPNGLTKWLIKKTPANGAPQEGSSKPAKRKRLDLWFTD